MSMESVAGRDSRRSLRGRIGHVVGEDDGVGRCLLCCCVQLRVEDFGMRTQGRTDLDGLNGAEEEGQRGSGEDEAVGWRDGEYDWGGHC